MQESIVFLVRVQCRRKESSRSLSHLPMSFLLNFCVSNGSATKSLRNGEMYYIYFIDSLFLFPTVKEFSKSVNSWWSYRKKFDTSFFLRHGVFLRLGGNGYIVLLTELVVCNVCYVWYLDLDWLYFVHNSINWVCSVQLPCMESVHSSFLVTFCADCSTVLNWSKNEKRTVTLLSVQDSSL